MCRDWPPNLFVFIGYAGLSSVIGGLEVLIGARIIASYGHSSYDHLGGREGFNLGALAGALQAPLMGSLFWSCSVGLNYREGVRILRERDLAKALCNLGAISIANLLSLVAAALILDANKDIGRAWLSQCAAPMVGIFYALLIKRVLSSDRPLAELQGVHEDVENMHTVTGSLGCVLQ